MFYIEFMQRAYTILFYMQKQQLFDLCDLGRLDRDLVNTRGKSSKFTFIQNVFNYTRDMDRTPN